MPVSSHVLRKLQEALGAEAADYLVRRMDEMESVRGDVSELRHEMQLGFARMDARFEQMDLRFETLRADAGGLIEKGLKEQTRFFFLAWSVILATIVGLYAR